MPEDDAKREKVKVHIYTSTHHRIEGNIVIHEGYRGRLSDVLNDGRVFLAVSEAKLYDTTSGVMVSQSRFLSVNKSAASVIVPVD